MRITLTFTMLTALQMKVNNKIVDRCFNRFNRLSYFSIPISMYVRTYDSYTVCSTTSSTTLKLSQFHFDEYLIRQPFQTLIRHVLDLFGKN